VARDERMKVWVETDFLELVRDPVFVSEDWALPRAIPVNADLETGEHVEIDIEVSRTSARARRVCVETNSPKGVGSTMLRRVPVRNAMAFGCAQSLLRITRQPDGTVALMPGDVRDEDKSVVVPLVENLIGYERLRTEERRTS
jgi:hypothetical protein